MSEIINYVIKDYTEHDFSSAWKTNKIVHEDNLEYFAQDIAEEHFKDDPCNPEDFECVVGVQWNGYTKWFQVNAQIDVDFFSDEIECPLDS